MLFHHQPVWEMDSLFRNEIIWSGFNGGTFTDNYVEKFNSRTKKDAITNFSSETTMKILLVSVLAILLTISSAHPSRVKI